jgi:diguanylate cyclase (GGDEF)-like protein
MKFPKVKDIASKKVYYVNESQSISEAVGLMYENDHRDVIVVSESTNRFGLLKVNDIIKFKLQKIDFSLKISSIKYDMITSIHEDESVLECLKEIDHINNCICVVNDNNDLVGFITYYDVVSSIDPQMMLERRPVGEILLTYSIKKTDISTKASKVAHMMNHALYDCVIVEEDDKPVGIVTTKDMIHLLGQNKDFEKPISSYMTTPLETVKSDTTIKEALEYIQKRKFKRLIVTNDSGEIIGQISQKEIIAKVYSKWAENMRDNDSQLREINKFLQARANKYEEMSFVDSLTGIFNRAKFEEILENEIYRIKRYKSETFSLIFFDIDHFKNINDTYGHLEGDNALKKVAQLVQSNIRTVDTVARWGGEEFVIIMPVTSAKGALQATQKLRKMISETDFEGIGKITCSFGISEFNHNDDTQSLIFRADKAMYSAKENGRNRVEIIL